MEYQRYEDYEPESLAAMCQQENMMSFQDQIKAALAKKQAAQHPDTKTDAGTKARAGKPPVVANKPQKKVTGRGR
jgi:hypothetical protein